MMILKEFSRIVCVSLFSYQGSLFRHLSTAHLDYHIHQCLSSTILFSFRSFYDVCASLSGDLSTLSHPYWIVNNFFGFFKTFQIVCSKESILCDSSIRIPLSTQTVNRFLIFLFLIFQPLFSN